MRLILGTLVLLSSFLGYSSVIKDKFNVKNSLIPFMLVSTYIFIIAIAARLSLMLESIIIVNIIGIILFLFSLKNIKLIKSLFPEYMLYFLCIILLYIYLSPKILTMYDDFSHWGLISRLMIQKNSINTSLDSTIYYKSYPQACAYFVYGIVKFLGYSEGHMMFANALIPLYGTFTIMSVFKNKLINYILGFIIIVFAFLYNIRPYSLLVDTILSTNAFGLFVFIYYLDNNEKNKKSKYFLIPMLVSLVYTKNSGLFLAIFSAIYIIIKFYKNDIKLVLISLLTIFIANKSWSNHVKFDFISSGKHSMNLSQYKRGLEGNKAYIDEFTKNFIKAILNDKFMYALLLIILLILIIKKGDKLFINLLVSIVLIYAIYQIGNYFMFITSMSAGELKRMASYDRYVRTIHLLFALITLFLINYKYNEAFIKLITLLFVLFAVVILDDPAEYVVKDLNFRYELKNIREKENIPSYKNILVKFKERDFTRLYTRVTMFEFDTDKVADTFVGDEKSFNPDEYDYVIDLSK